MTGIVAPHNLEAEQSVLGACLLDRDAITQVSSLLEPGDFYSPAHGAVYGAVLELYRRRTPADLMTVTDALTRSGRIDDIGGVSFLAALLTSVPVTVHAGYYAEIVARHAKARRLIRAGSEIVRLAYDEAADIDATLADARRLLAGLTRDTGTGRFQTMAQAVGPFALEVEQRWNGDWADDLMPTNFYDLDNALGGGFERQQAVFVGGRPGMAKTSFALQVILNYARRCRVTQQTPDWSVFYSSEMTLRALLWRALSENTGIPARNLKRGLDALERPLDDLSKQRIRRQMAELEALPIVIDDTSGPTTQTMRERLERFMVDHPVRFMCFDYLEQAGNPKERGGNQEERIAQIAADIKSIAKTCDITALALSQLNRAVESRDDKIPTIADLRQSGRIEQEADVIILLYRQDYYAGKNMLKPEQIDPEKVGTCDLILAKQRDGMEGTFTVQFIPELTAFRNLERRVA
jgi:replicative DNA helicase